MSARLDTLWLSKPVAAVNTAGSMVSHRFAMLAACVWLRRGRIGLRRAQRAPRVVVVVWARCPLNQIRSVTAQGYSRSRRQRVKRIDKDHVQRRKMPPILRQQNQFMRTSRRRDNNIGKAGISPSRQRTVRQRAGFPADSGVERKNSIRPSGQQLIEPLL